MVTIIVVVGMPGSGKDILVQSAIALGFGHISMGDVVRAHATKIGLGSSDESIGGFASSERKKHGDAIWAERTLERMPTGNVIIDGSRSLAEINLFRKRLGDGLKVLVVTASQEIRFQRLKLRHRDDDPKTLEDFTRRDERELKWGIGEAIGSADIIIGNNGRMDEFRAQCQTILKSIAEAHRKSI